MPTPIPVLDDFDRRILAALQIKGDLTQEELADRVHLSRSQCSRRVARLREEGVIDRVVAVLRPEAVGLSLKAYVTVSLRSHADEHTSAFNAFVMATPEVLECCMLTGHADYLLRVWTVDLGAFDAFVHKLLQNPGVATVRSSIVLRDIKQTNALPLDR